MNILYLSHLIGESFAGPTYSVPKQIEAQSKIDNVFWYNAVNSELNEWKNLSFYHDKTEYPNEKISDLPEPFNNPDIVVVELFYNMVKSPLMWELLKGAIPYIIIPRGELTKQAQARKKLKKMLANIFVCKRYAKKAVAIQYLTEQEYKDAGDEWNGNHLIIPNGIDLPKETKQNFSKKEIRCIFVGRIEPYQKGLDMLIEACSKIKEVFIDSNCIVTICGPDKEGKLKELKEKVNAEGLDKIIEFHDGVYGDEKSEMLIKSDVFLIPSRFEGHPMALIEALSYGLPAIATTGSNMKEEIEKYNAGWTSDNSVEALVISISTMIKERGQLKIKSQNARQLAEMYKWEIIANRTHEQYTQILES